MPQLRRSAPYVLLNRADATCVWGRLQAHDVPVKLATVWGAAGRTGDVVTVWFSESPEAARLAATGQVPRRKGVRGLFGLAEAPVRVSRRDLTDADVVLAVLMAIHPRGVDGWPGDALPQEVQTQLMRTVVTRRRSDGSDWQARDQRSADAVAGLVCAMADSWAADPSAASLRRLTELADELPDTVGGCTAAVDELFERPAFVA